MPCGEIERKGAFLFELHTEWLSKDKVNRRVELGHTILVAGDQWGFIFIILNKKGDRVRYPSIKTLL
ncbi:MAG: hypothetical protein MRJ65_02580 [Candidatus Brocadiaceae bacterium]|nr:hypothetical protein [Candidatus Brocadiaceae bacterium]